MQPYGMRRMDNHYCDGQKYPRQNWLGNHIVRSSSRRRSKHERCARQRQENKREAIALLREIGL